MRILVYKRGRKMERFTEYHAEIPVLKDKTKMKEAMARFAGLPFCMLRSGY